MFRIFRVRSSFPFRLHQMPKLADKSELFKPAITIDRKADFRFIPGGIAKTPHYAACRRDAKAGSARHKCTLVTAGAHPCNMHAVRCSGIEHGPIYVHQIAGGSMINRFLQLLTIPNYVTVVVLRVVQRVQRTVYFLPIVSSLSTDTVLHVYLSPFH